MAVTGDWGYMAWFLEPDHPDTTWAKRRESPFSWLNRSTLPRAAAARDFMNRNLEQLPIESQNQLFTALRTRWASAFFELVVARTLQLLGASIEIESASLNGTKIDFLATFKDGSASVEAVSPVIDDFAGFRVRDQSPLLDIIERHVP